MNPGIDLLKDNPDKTLKNRNVVLITGSSNIDSDGVPVYLSIKQAAGDRLKAIWSLQHGFFVDKQDNMILSNSFTWRELELPIKSLYGKKLLPDDSWLKDIDAIVIDLFDVGTRVYTFVNHIVMLMKHLSGENIDIIVLDRPNPLSGLCMEGNVMEEAYFSIVGQLPVPMRHGLTAGEFLGFALNYYNIDLQLEVVRVKNWKREQLYNGTWTYPSPNMPTFDTAAVYPGAVLLEGTNISEGRGTTRPFEFVGAPFIDNFKVAAELRALGFKGVTFIPVFFKPEFSKYTCEVCKGIYVKVDDYYAFRSFQVYYELIRLIRNSYPERFRWQEPPYEFEYTRPPIDMICGSAMISRGIENNTPYAELFPEIETQLNDYRERIEPHLLYS
ncbi:MAG: DUF1343 domain-containing protein [bacterium]|nr:DUF1343 domain-containing protein [bacterium]